MFILCHVIPQKEQPIQIQKGCCRLDGITPIVHFTYVTLIVLATEFSMAWYKIQSLAFFAIQHEISHLLLVCIIRKLNWLGTSHDVTLKNVTYFFKSVPYYVYHERNDCELNSHSFHDQYTHWRANAQNVSFITHYGGQYTFST